MRRPNTRPTVVYWLVDTRSGIPFYCGKTVNEPNKRLIQHRAAARKFPNRELSLRLNECARVKITVMETVPTSEDWVEREKFWISEIRRVNQSSVNICSGGQGAPGFMHREDTKLKISAAHENREFSEQHRSRISASLKGRQITPEWRAKISGTLSGSVLPDETKRKISSAMKGRRKSPETVANMTAAQRKRREAELGQ